MSILLLVPFSIIVMVRARGIHEASAIPFCAVRFDCGCGSGEVNICYKLVENSLLIIASGLLLVLRSNRWCLQHALVTLK